MEIDCEVSPNDGGCWFCFSDKGEMHFSCEFDAYFHFSCLEDAVQEMKDLDLEDPETLIIAREFGIE